MSGCNHKSHSSQVTRYESIKMKDQAISIRISLLLNETISDYLMIYPSHLIVPAIPVDTICKHSRWKGEECTKEPILPHTDWSLAEQWAKEAPRRT